MSEFFIKVVCYMRQCTYVQRTILSKILKRTLFNRTFEMSIQRPK